MRVHPCAKYNYKRYRNVDRNNVFFGESQNSEGTHNDTNGLPNDGHVTVYVGKHLPVHFKEELVSIIHRRVAHQTRAD